MWKYLNKNISTRKSISIVLIITVFFIVLIYSQYSYSYMPEQFVEIRLSENKEVINKEEVSFIISPDLKSFDSENNTFEGKKSGTEQTVKIFANNSTKFYKGMLSGGIFTIEKYYSFSEFQSLLEGWADLKNPLTVIGIAADENLVKANEIFFLSQ